MAGDDSTMIIVLFLCCCLSLAGAGLTWYENWACVLNSSLGKSCSATSTSLCPTCPICPPPSCPSASVSGGSRSGSA